MNNMQNQSAFFFLDGENNVSDFKLHKNDKRKIFLFCTSVSNTEKVININMEESFSESEAIILVVGTGNQDIKIKTTQKHQRSETKSRLLVKSVLFGQSSFDFEGLICIEKQAEKSEASLENYNLLMSSKASVNIKPYLEIKNKDVICSHGSATSTINSEEFYYLKSRGITDKNAERLIVKGFLRDIIDRVSDDKKFKMIEKRINDKLNRAL